MQGVIAPSSLHAFQTRLNERMQKLQTVEAQPSSETMHWLAVELAARSYGLPLVQLGEIHSISPPTAVAYTCEWFLGVANIRGALFGVSDLAHYLQVPDAQNPRRKAELFKPNSSARYITLHSDFGINCALLVDRLMGMRTHVQALEVSRLDLRELILTQAFLDIYRKPV